MHGRLRTIAGHHTEPLAQGWEFTSCATDTLADPTALALHAGEWMSATAPCTVASALRAAGRWSLDDLPRRFDAEDWWFRTTFRTDAAGLGEQLWLCFDGLATVADVWLNGAPILEARGMFTAHECRVDLAQRLADLNTLAIRFRSLDALLAARRPRPRWRTPMVDHQQLRWFRATLLGRTPGWSPPAAAVGPWRPIRLERRRGVDVSALRLRAEGDGRLKASARIDSLDSLTIDKVELLLHRGGRTHRIPMVASADRISFAVETLVPDVERWWPHTHGEPALYAADLEIRRGKAIIQAEVGGVGFRSIGLDTADGDFRVRINGEPVFCRGACWTPLDVVSLDATDASLDEAFAQLVQSGMNMVRVSGTMVYERDAFLDRCDQHGVLLWQDFMFANMDYPENDPAFAGEVTAEVTQLLGRLEGRPSVAILCGNSEGEQQAAMWGAPREQWAHPVFHRQIAELVQGHCPQVPYWPSSTHGGAFPHQGSAGSASYYGVGAYLRPLEDARRAEVRFASECLAFANIPEEAALERIPSAHRLRSHYAVWKARAPRDLGAGWDFDDVRDHYVQRLFGVDPFALRYADHERYLDIGRVATGEVMAATFLEWRRSRSATRGGLIWFLRDLWPGAGWGVIDSDGVPKASWYYLRRALAPLAVGLSDEGGNGISVHVMNDRAEAFTGTLELALFRAGEVRVGDAAAPLVVAARTTTELDAVALFDGFRDLSYAYRFGPPAHDLEVATARDGAGFVRARAYHFIGGWPSGREPDVGLTAQAHAQADGLIQLTVRTRRFAQSVHVEFVGYRAEDDYFHLVPGEERQLLLRPVAGRAPAQMARGIVRALNSEMAARVTLT